MNNISQVILECEDKIKAFKERLPLNDYRVRLDQIDFMSNDPKFWEDSGAATKVMKERTELDSILSFINRAEENIEFYKEFMNDKEFQNEASAEVNNFASQVNNFEFKLMYNKPEDKMDAVISISSGAGGLEASNWVFMLLRMYLRFCEAKGYKTFILDEHRSEENSATCIDSITLQVSGDYAYGNLKSESGVHRLIRNSPFSSADARHTSFAAVQVLPDLDDNIDIKINPNDVEITAQTGKQSAGGQNANKVASCALFHHIPTGIKFRVQNERSLTQNKETGFKILKGKLYDLEMKKRQEDEEKRLGQQSDISFGSQIRTYTFTPYQLVKDHRTSEEISDIQLVMDGHLDPFVKSYLTYSNNST